MAWPGRPPTTRAWPSAWSDCWPAWPVATEPSAGGRRRPYEVLSAGCRYHRAAASAILGALAECPKGLSAGELADHLTKLIPAREAGVDVIDWPALKAQLVRLRELGAVV